MPLPTVVSPSSAVVISLRKLILKSFLKPTFLIPLWLAFEYAEPLVTSIYSFLLKGRMRWAGHVANIGAKLLARRPERNILQYLTGDNIKMNLKEVDLKGF
jgi:hypothetical protein